MRERLLLAAPRCKSLSTMDFYLLLSGTFAFSFSARRVTRRLTAFALALSGTFPFPHHLFYRPTPPFEFIPHLPSPSPSPSPCPCSHPYECPVTSFGT